MKGWLNREPFTPIVMPRDCSMSVAVSALSATRSGAMPLGKIGFVGFGSRSECYPKMMLNLHPQEHSGLMSIFRH
jgi:hypothetical protein